MRAVVSGDKAGLRLDRYLTGEGFVPSRALGQKWIKAGAVRVNGTAVKSSHSLEEGDVVEIDDTPPVTPSTLLPEDIPLDIACEDDDLLIVRKPAGLVVHPGAGVSSGTLANALLHRLQSAEPFADPMRPGIVHRLDRDTSGLLVVAKNPASQAKLGKMIQERQVTREYMTIVWGVVDEAGTIDLPIGRSHGDRRKMAVVPEGRRAVTHYERVEPFRFASLLRVRLETGRTHQIRVHFSHTNHPVFGDETYGGRASAVRGVHSNLKRPALIALGCIDRQALHAARLAFPHPTTGEPVECEDPMPLDFCTLLEALRADRDGIS